MTRLTPIAFRSLQLFMASAAALTLAVWLGLQNPFWAAMPVWVVMQAWREDLVVRAVLRVAGTVAGAALAWAVLHYVADPALRVGMLATIIGVAVGTAFWIGTIFNYGAMLVAITAISVILPAVDHTLDPTAYALDRLYCTLIGVVAVTLATFPFTPRRTEPRPARHAPSKAETARRAGFAVFVALLGGGMLVAGAHGTIFGGIMGMTVFATLTGSMVDPRPVLDNLPKGALIGVLTAIVYRLIAGGLDLSGLALVWLALPFLGIGAYLRAHPATTGLGLDANMVFLLAAEAGASGQGLLIHAVGGFAMVAAAYLVVAIYRTGHITPIARAMQ